MQDCIGIEAYCELSCMFVIVPVNYYGFHATEVPVGSILVVLMDHESNSENLQPFLGSNAIERLFSHLVYLQDEFE